MDHCGVSGRARDDRRRHPSQARARTAHEIGQRLAQVAAPMGPVVRPRAVVVPEVADVASIHGTSSLQVRPRGATTMRPAKAARGNSPSGDVRVRPRASASRPTSPTGVGAALQQAGQLTLFGTRQRAEHRRSRDPGDQAFPDVDPGRCQRQRRDAPVPGRTRTAHKEPPLEPIDEEGDVRRITVQALRELTPRQRAASRVQLPQRVRERHRQIQLGERLVQLRLERGMQSVCRQRELVCRSRRVRRATLRHPGIVWDTGEVFAVVTYVKSSRNPMEG
jgi:hypothetical protein